MEKIVSSLRIVRKTATLRVSAIYGSFSSVFIGQPYGCVRLDAFYFHFFCDACLGSRSRLNAATQSSGCISSREGTPLYRFSTCSLKCLASTLRKTSGGCQLLPHIRMTLASVSSLVFAPKYQIHTWKTSAEMPSIYRS